MRVYLDFTIPFSTNVTVVSYSQALTDIPPGDWTLISSKDKGLMAFSLERLRAAPLGLRLRVGGVGGIPGFSGLMVPCIRDAGVLRVGCGLCVDGLTRELPNFPQSMPNLRSLQLSRDKTGERDHYSGRFDLRLDSSFRLSEGESFARGV